MKIGEPLDLPYPIPLGRKDSPCSMTIAKRTFPSNAQDTKTFYDSIKSTTGTQITFGTIRHYAKTKDKNMFKSILKLFTDQTKEMATNDIEATDIILRMLKGKLLFCNQHYFKFGHVWISDKEKIHHAVMRFIMEAPIFKPLGNDKEILHWANYSSAEKLTKGVLGQISLDQTDYTKFHTTTKHKFCFLNGVLDFKEDRFYTWDQVDFEYYPVVQIPMDYGPANADIMKDIKTKVLEPLFGDKMDLALKFLSRSLAGCTEDKNFATYIGNRNCGKGVLYELLQAFGDYVGPFSVKNILCDRKGHGAETSRDNYWLMEFEFMRLAVSQEIPPECVGMKLKSEAIKRICSGGDTQIARRNYDRRDTKFQIETALLSMGNESINMEGDVLEHHLGFESAIQFKDQAFIDKVREELGDLATCKYRVADSMIKQLCASSEWRLAFIHLMRESFTHTQITVECEVEVSNPMMEAFNAD